VVHCSIDEGPQHGLRGSGQSHRETGRQQSGADNRRAHSCIYDNDDIGRYLNIADGNLQLVQLLLKIGVFLGHLFVLGFPLAVGDFECLDLSLVVAGLDVGLAESKLL
jgi:hypothetical protein